MEQLINNLKKRLKAELPGAEAQYKLAPLNRKKPQPIGELATDYRKSAVMILLCLDAEQNWYIPLIERMAYEGVHSAQISFPGGKHEDHDVDLKQTALRECDEEIGLSNIELLGELSDLYIPVSKFLVKPFIGLNLEPNLVFKPHPREVNRVLHLPLNKLLEDKIIEWGDVPVQNGMRINVPYIGLESKKIWGATAMILSELREVLRTIS
ncbi:MAG: CoA pyrophosphatase [Bacteroidota bacterium]